MGSQILNWSKQLTLNWRRLSPVTSFCTKPSLHDSYTCGSRLHSHSSTRSLDHLLTGTIWDCCCGWVDPSVPRGPVEVSPEASATVDSSPRFSWLLLAVFFKKKFKIASKTIVKFRYTVNTRSICHVKLRFFYGKCHIKVLHIP
jgi:hypothetical protein